MKTEVLRKAEVPFTLYHCNVIVPLVSSSPDLDQVNINTVSFC